MSKSSIIAICTIVKTYDLYRPVRNAFDAGKSITRASRRGMGPGIETFLGPLKWY